MKRLLMFGLLAVAVAFWAVPASALPLSSTLNNTFGGAAIVEDAGYLGAAVGTQGDLWNFAGSDVSIMAGGAGVNLPQAFPVFGDINGDTVVDAADALPSPAGAIFETTQVKDGATFSFGQEVTMVMGGLWPAALSAVGPIGIGVLDNGLAPGSTAADGNLDQLTRAGGTSDVIFRVDFGPAFASPFPLPVFEIYDDVPPLSDLNIGAGNVHESEFDFDGAGAPLGPTTPPPTASPSQFENGADGFPLPNEVSKATDGALFAAGWINGATATYRFFDPNVLGSGLASTGMGPNGGYVFQLDFTATGVITDGYLLPLLGTGNLGGVAYDGSPITITFTATLYGEVFLASTSSGIDQFSTWDIRTTLAGNSGDASFTIPPVIPEPTTIGLVGLALCGLAGRRLRRKK